jgi:ABC-2 type transport system ATP-binding protein
MTPAIVTEALAKNYRGKPALLPLDLTIPQGAFFGLLGPNGAGKSTLIHLLAGLLPPTAGRAAILDFDVVKQARDSRRHLGVVPQELVYDPFFTVQEFLEIQAGYFGLPLDKAWREELLGALSLLDKAKASLSSLSGGMKRRVLIAQALVHRPPVVVLDEPTAGVDVELRNSLWKFIKELHRQGHTIVLTTHYLTEAETLCDEIAILRNGRLLKQAKKADLLACAPPRLQLTLASAPAMLPESLLPFQPQLVDNVLSLSLEKEKIALLLALLADLQWPVLALETHSASLEEVFLQLVQQDAKGDALSGLV